LAIACELGPLAGAILRQACPGDPEDVAELMAWTSDTVWREFTLPIGIGIEGAHPWSSAPYPWTSFEVNQTADPSLLRIQTQNVSGSATFFMTDVVSGGTIAGPLLEPLPSEVLPSGNLPPGSFGVGLGWAGGPASGTIFYDIPGLGISAARSVLQIEGSSWMQAPYTCSDGAAAAFTTYDRELWYAWGDGITIQWASLGVD
jgi:hypothetical protein